MSERPKQSLIPTALLIGALTSGLLLAVSLELPIQTSQEAVYAIDIISVLHGNCLLTHSIGRKPPLYLWLGAICSEVGGRASETSARMPGIVAAGAIAALLFLWTSRHLGRRTGVMVWLSLLSMGGFVSNFVTAQVDSLMVLAIYAALVAMRPAAGESAWRARDAISAGVALGLGVLCKGPLPVGITVASVGAYLLITRLEWSGAIAGRAHLTPDPVAEDWKQEKSSVPSSLLPVFRRWRSKRSGAWGQLWVAVAAMLAIALPWYIAGLIADGRQFAQIVYQENLGHLLPGGAGGTGEAARPVYFIAARLFTAALPMVLFAPAAVCALWHESDRARREFLLYATMPIWVVLIVFSLAAAKRDVYILPAIPALAILTGDLLARAFEGQLPAGWCARLANAATYVTGLAAIALAAGSLAAVAGVVHVPSMQLHHTDRIAIVHFLNAAADRAPWFVLFVTATIASAAALWNVFKLRWDGSAAVGATMFALTATLTWQAVIRPAVARAETEKHFLAEMARRFPDASGSLALLNYDEQAEFYLGRELPVLRPDGLPREPYVLSTTGEMPTRIGGAPATVLMRSDGMTPHRLVLARIGAPAKR